MRDTPCGSGAYLSPEDFLRLARGDDPNRPPMWNGPPHITTPPASPTRPMAAEGQMFEFLFPYPIHIFDSADWPPLRIVRDGTEVHLLKPLSMPVAAKEQVAAGNESPDLYSSNVRAIVLKTSQGFPTTHHKVFGVVRHALQWTRVLSRQYWIGTGVAGVSATYRGSAFRVEGTTVRQMNYASYGATVLVRALPRASWESLRTCVEQSLPVPVSESIFCDALSSFAAGDTVRCVVELGVAVEIELTNLLDDLAAQRPSAIATRKYLKEREYLGFRKKLLHCSVRLGCADPKHFSIAQMPVDWADRIVSLYKFRNKAAHEGRCVISDDIAGVRPLAEGELQSFIFSVETLYQWSREQRLKFGLHTPVLSASRPPQIVAILGEALNGGGFVLDTSESFSADSRNVDSSS